MRTDRMAGSGLLRMAEGPSARVRDPLSRCVRQQRASETAINAPGVRRVTEGGGCTFPPLRVIAARPDRAFPVPSLLMNHDRDLCDEEGLTRLFSHGWQSPDASHLGHKVARRVRIHDEINRGAVCAHE